MNDLRKRSWRTAFCVCLLALAALLVFRFRSTLEKGGGGAESANGALSQTGSGGEKPVGDGAAAPAAAGVAAGGRKLVQEQQPADGLALKGRREREAAEARARREGWDPAKETDGPSSRLMAIRNGKPCVYIEHNSNAGISIGADLIRMTAPYNLSGAGERIGIWDSAHVRSTHQELAGRVAVKDGVPVWGDHSTHVGGTIGASGVTAGAIGAAVKVGIDSYEWADDLAEMAAAGMTLAGETNKIQVSNQSYGEASGWNDPGGGSPLRWYGTWGERESDSFGGYETGAAEMDSLCRDVPYLLPFVSCGNDRGDAAPATGEAFRYYDGGWIETNYSPAIHPYADNWDDGGFDTIGMRAGAKNVMAIGSVSDAVSGGIRSVGAAGMTVYSSWGPTDDGRIKPDLAANGDVVCSCIAQGDATYSTMSGSSMAVASASGAAELLIEFYGRLFSGSRMRASTLKALLIHSADDILAPGPDYKTGWGLMNVKAAADHLLNMSNFGDLPWLREDSLSDTDPGDSFAVAWSNGGPLKVTLCWTDPAAVPLTALDDRTPRLVNDLDLRITDPSGATNLPYVLDVLHPANSATNGDNSVDNVEQIFLPAPATSGTYTVWISAKGAIAGFTQHYAVAVSGFLVLPRISHEPLQNTTNEAGPYQVGASVRTLDGLASGFPKLMWNTNGPAGGFSSVAMSQVSNEVYAGQIPGQPLGTTVYYYIAAETTNSRAATDPAGAPDDLHGFQVVEPVSLFVDGSPAPYGAAAPPYGWNYPASGIVMQASADAHAMQSNGHRFACTGWSGTGSVPAAGDSNSVSFRIERSSGVIWQWTDQYALAQTSSPPGLLSTTTWWNASSSGQTVTAASTAVSGSVTYCFAGWYVDGMRAPDSSNAAVNPAVGISMLTSKVAEARYLPSGLDADGDGMKDWWEVFHFGTTNASQYGDEDSDGYGNGEEFADLTNPRSGDDSPRPPVISHVPMSDPADCPAPWEITASITDNCAVASAALHWRKNGLPTERQTAMTTSDAPDIHRGTIPAPGVNGDTFVYWITAVDAAGYSTNGGEHTFQVAYPVHQTIPEAFGIFNLLPDTATNTFLTLTNSGMAELNWRIGRVFAGMADDCESGTNGWTHEGQHDMWHLSAHRCWSAGHSWYCGYESLHQYTDSMDASLITPSIRVPACAQLVFRQWIKTELDTGNYAWDGGVVEISEDGGGYAAIAPTGGYPYLVVDNPASPFAADTPCFAGTGGWHTVRFDLSAYAGKNARVRFRFGSDGFVTDEGWYIDDVNVFPMTTTDSWLTVSSESGILAQSEATNVLVTVSAAGFQAGRRETLVLDLASNDPLLPTNALAVYLDVRSLPVLSLTTCGQTSTDGSGRVTIECDLAAEDGHPCELEILHSDDGGESWAEAWLAGAAAAFGAPVFTNGLSPVLAGIVTSDGEDTLLTNSLAIVWDSTNGPSPVLLATNAMVSLRAWNGAFWGAAVTSQPFMVDNEAPSGPADVSSLTHTAGQWSTGRVIRATWAVPADDGAGAGVTGYMFVFTNCRPADVTGGTVTGSAAAEGVLPADGSNWWAAMRAFDAYGNCGAITAAGPFMIDTVPPSAASASVQIARSAAGAYFVGSVVTSVWSGFTDSGSGIAGYYFGFSDGGGTTDGTWTVSTAGALSGAALDATNSVYVWAKDNCGLTGVSVGDSLLVLSPGGDWDGDGLPNWEEEVAGCDAGDSLSLLALEDVRGIVESGMKMVIVWTSVSGRCYSVQSAGTIAGEWNVAPAFSNVPAVGGQMSCTNLIPGARGYFRVKVEQAPQ